MRHIPFRKSSGVFKDLSFFKGGKKGGGTLGDTKLIKGGIMKGKMFERQ